ncbi:hypothetical protein SAMN04515667_0056 [Formosa sp. Hel1_31_208]|nr:hypothetical protein SAMN04515667_0056 [Formosa sp. Hel1_31_208]
MQIQQVIKTTAFIIAISAVVIFSKQIQNQIVSSYNHCVGELSNRTLASNNLSGF